jgi:hypothetical protein
MGTDNKCFECGCAAILKHHVVPKSVGGKKTVPLCGLCHEKIHDIGGDLSRSNIHKSSLLPRRPNKLTWDVAVRILNLHGGGMSMRKINKNIPEISLDTIQRTITGEGSLPKAIRNIQKTLCDQCLFPDRKV